MSNLSTTQDLQLRLPPSHCHPLWRVCSDQSLGARWHLDAALQDFRQYMHLVLINVLLHFYHWWAAVWLLCLARHCLVQLRYPDVSPEPEEHRFGGCAQLSPHNCSVALMDFLRMFVGDACPMAPTRQTAPALSLRLRLWMASHLHKPRFESHGVQNHTNWTLRIGV